MNAVGYGAPSDPTTITYCRSPLQMATPTNSTVAATYIIINWTALTGTTNTGNDPLLNYIL